MLGMICVKFGADLINTSKVTSRETVLRMSHSRISFLQSKKEKNLKNLVIRTMWGGLLFLKLEVYTCLHRQSCV